MDTNKEFRLPIKSKALRMAATALGCVLMLVAAVVAFPLVMVWGLLKGSAYMAISVADICLQCVQQNWGG